MKNTKQDYTVFVEEHCFYVQREPRIFFDPLPPERWEIAEQLQAELLGLTDEG